MKREEKTKQVSWNERQKKPVSTLSHTCARLCIPAYALLRTYSSTLTAPVIEIENSPDRHAHRPDRISRFLSHHHRRPARCQLRIRLLGSGALGIESPCACAAFFLLPHEAPFFTYRSEGGLLHLLSFPLAHHVNQDGVGIIRDARPVVMHSLLPLQTCVKSA